MSLAWGALLRAAPGIAAKGLAGKTQGTQMRQQQERQTAQDALARAVAEFNMQNATERNALERESMTQTEQLRRDQLAAAAADREQQRTFQQALEEARRAADLEGKKELLRLSADLRPPSQPRVEPNDWTIRTMADGTEVRVNTRTGETAPLGYKGPPKATGGARETEAKRRGMALYELAAPSVERIRAQRDKGFAVSTKDIASERGPDWATNWMISDEGQAYFNDMTNLVMATQYAVSGAAATEQEARRIARTLMPRVGDKELVRRNKDLDVDNRMRIFESLAGKMGTTPPEASGNAADRFDAWKARQSQAGRP